MSAKFMSVSLLVGLAALQSCRTGGDSGSRNKDVFTVTRAGKVVLFRGGSDKVTVRECPDLAALKEATGKDAIEAAIAQYCPKTDTNEKTFDAQVTKKFILDGYQQSYIPAGIPTDPELGGIKNSADQTASANAAAAAAANVSAKDAALKLRAEINSNIERTTSQLTALQNYCDANPDLLDDAGKAKLADFKKTLADQQAKLATVSDEAIAKAAQDRLNNVEAKKAKDWADAYAKFMDEKLLSPLFDSTKLVRLSESNPLQAQLMAILAVDPKYPCQSAAEIAAHLINKDHKATAFCLHKVLNPSANLQSGKAIPANHQLKAGLDVAFLNETRNFDGAQTACQTLGAGWQAPASENPQATPRAIDHNKSLEAIGGYFSRTSLRWIWSSSTVSRDSRHTAGSAWLVNLEYGGTYGNVKNDSYYVVCVMP